MRFKLDVYDSTADDIAAAQRAPETHMLFLLSFIIGVLHKKESWSEAADKVSL
jgi:hypothetical protein